MAIGALKAARADYAISISGIAGPDGGSGVKSRSAPSGLALPGPEGRVLAQRQQFTGDRDAVRRQATSYCAANALATISTKHLILYDHTV